MIRTTFLVHVHKGTYLGISLGEDDFIRQVKHYFEVQLQEPDLSYISFTESKEDELIAVVGYVDHDTSINALQGFNNFCLSRGFVWKGGIISTGTSENINT